MVIIAIILSGLALLAATGSLILIIQEKKRSEKQRAAMLQYIDTQDSGYVERTNKLLKELLDAYKKSYADSMRDLKESYERRIRDLETGMVPDFEEAKAAANAVNDFNRGLSNILGFDPIQEARKAREKAMNGGEVE